MAIKAVSIRPLSSEIRHGIIQVHHCKGNSRCLITDQVSMKHTIGLKTTMDGSKAHKLTIKVDSQSPPRINQS